MLFLDTSALVKRYLDEDGREHVLALMESDRQWTASRIARTEAAVTLCRLFPAPDHRATAQAALAVDWARFTAVAADERCLSRAAELGCSLGLSTLDAIHLAATDGLPPGLTFVSYDRRLRSGAERMGLAVQPRLAG
jgi:predicted nucleic acid-binding protein